MKPAPFDYLAPRSTEEALELVTEHGFDAKLLAGGQSLIPLLNFRLASPAVLIDLNPIAELDFVRSADDGSLRIGAMTRQGTLEHHPLVASHAPLLAETIPFVAHPQIRNRGTIGGTLAHADPSAELPAIAVALRMSIRVRSARGERWIAAREFFTGLLSTDLAPDEMVVEIAVPPLPARTGCSFLEISRRHGDYAQVGVAATVTLGADGSCTEATLAYLSVGDTPLLAPRAAELLLGGGLSDDQIEAAAESAAGSEIEPYDDIHATAAFKRRLARVLTRRALTTARDRARSEGGER